MHIRNYTRAFTLVEILSAIMIIALLTTVIGVFVSSAKTMAQKVSDQKTLETLNDALTRYKGEGGNVNALTSGKPIPHAIAALQTQVTWAGLTHQFLTTAFTKPARSIFAKGTGATYRFSGFNTYTSESGGTSIQGVLARIFLTTTGAGTWTVPSDWNSGNNTVECIGGGGSACQTDVNHGGGGGGGAYAKSVNLVLTAGTSINLSVGGSAAATWFNATSLANAQGNGASVSCAADFGITAGTSAGGAGGQAGNSVGTIKYSGGAGANSSGYGGGGGAGGPHGNGGAGGALGPGYNEPGGGGGGGGGADGQEGGCGNGSCSHGGNGGNNYLGAGGGAGDARGVSAAQAGTAGGGGGGGEVLSSPSPNGGNGGNGTDWDSSHGSGGGGGGGVGWGVGGIGGTGGIYGGGAGASGAAQGAQGIIVISYTH